MIQQTLLRHRELHVTPMIPRFSTASIPSQTVVPRNLTSWSESSGLIFNQSKCKYQCITRKKSPVQRNDIINETPLESCDIDLVVWVSSNLTSHSVRKPANSSALCAELLGTSKAPKRVVHFMFLSSGAISAKQPKYGRLSPQAY